MYFGPDVLGFVIAYILISFIYFYFGKIQILLLKLVYGK